MVQILYNYTMIDDEKKLKEVYKSSKRFYFLVKDLKRRDLVNKPYNDLNTLFGCFLDFDRNVKYITDVLSYDTK